MQVQEEEEILKQFLGNYPRSSVVQKVVTALGRLTDEERFQDAILRLLYHLYLSPFASQYPPPPAYRLRLLTDIIKQLEAAGRCLPDLTYDLHSRLSAQPDRDRSDGHVTYQLTEGRLTRPLVIWENRQLLAAGTTGLRTWQAGKTLLDWYSARPEMIAGKNVLELGAGLGLTGLAISRLCSPECYTITDGHPLVVQMLKYNVEENVHLFNNPLPVLDETGCAEFLVSEPTKVPPLASPRPAPPTDPEVTGVTDTTVTLGRSKVTARSLDWFTFTEEEARQMHVDLVLAADVSYAPELHAPLVRTMCLLLRQLRPPPQVVLALTERNETTTGRLMNELGAQGLRAQLLATPCNTQSSFLMDEPSKVRVYEIVERLPAKR